MTIDTHQHYWHYRAQDFPWVSAAMPVLQQDWLPPQAQPAMQACGVTGVVAVQARSDAQETDFLLQLAERHAHILGVVGWADLAAADLDERLDRWSAHAAFKGLRHILQDEPQLDQLLDASAFNRGVQRLQQRRLVYDVLVFDRQLPAVQAFCRRHDAHWLVLDHVGKPAVRDWYTRDEVPKQWRSALQALAAMPHLVCKFSGLVTEADWARHGGVLPAQDLRVLHECFDRALDAFGPDRILFGSDWPVCQLAAPYASVHGVVQQWASTRLTAQEQHAFWHANATRCYALPTRTEPV